MSTAAPIPVKGQSLDPLVLDIGRLLGLLQAANGGGGADGAYTLNSAWFDDPLSATRQGVQANAAQLTDLLERVLGSIGGNALGVPASDPALLGTWIPIPDPSNNNQPTNLYVVSTTQGKATVFGFGAKVGWEKSVGAALETSGDFHGPSGVKVEAWALLPLLKIDPTNGISVAAGAADAPISVGVAIEGQDKNGAPAPIISAGTEGNLFAFNGVKLSAGITLTDPPAVDFSLVVLNLELPGETAADRSLADLEALTAAEIMQVASTLLVAALSDLSDEAAKTAGYLLPVFGLSGFVPGSDTELPLLAWYDLAASASTDRGAAAPIVDWFTQISADAALTTAWLASLSGLFGVTGAAPTGTGTRADPFLTPLLAAGVLPGALSFSLACEVDAGGLRRLYPGLVFAATPVALGTAAQLAFGFTVELAEFKLPAQQPPAFAGPSSLRLAATLALKNTDPQKPLFQGAIGGDNYTFGKFQAGFALDAAGDIAPLCQLLGIVSPVGDFDVLDLTSPGQIASTAKDELFSLIESGLKQMLGITASANVPFAGHLAALIGVIPPPSASSWTGAGVPQPPFVAAQIAQSIQDPVAALAAYYQALLTSTAQVDGQPVFHWLLTEFAALFTQDTTGAAIVISGSGTAGSPWQATLSVAGSTLPAALSAYVETPLADVSRLFLGLALAPVITLPDGLVFSPVAGMHFLSLDLPAPASALPVTACWLPDVFVALTLPKGFQTPPVANSFFNVASAALSANWSRHDSWAWSVNAAAPAFNINGTRLPFAQDLNWSDQDSLQQLVQAGATFTPVLLGTLGIALSATGTRAGTALSGILGLLPDPTAAANFPAALLPLWQAAALDPLSLSALDNPWPDLLKKLANDVASPANGQAVLGLLGWALNPGQSAPPAVTGTGTDGDPWRVPILGSAFEAVFGFDPATSLLGLGLGRGDHHALGSGLAIDVATTLDAAQFSLANGAFADAAPSLDFVATFSRTGGGSLVEIGSVGDPGYLKVGRLALGFSISLEAGVLACAPVVSVLETQLPGTNAAADYSFGQLASMASSVLQNFENALGQTVQTAVAGLLAAPAPAAATFRTTYGLLADLGLALAVPTEATSGFGINPGGFQALLADPLGYLRSRLLTLAGDTGLRATLFQWITGTLGIRLPAIPAPVLEVLSALGFLGGPETGYALQPQALLRFAQNPFEALRTQFDLLFPAPDYLPSDAVRALISALDQSLATVSFGPYFSFRAYQGTQISLSITPENAFSLGEVVTISGAVSFDLVKKTVSAGVSLYNPKIGFALEPSFAYTAGGTPASALDVVWGNGSVPAAPALPLYPFDSGKFLDQLADLAPAYVLSTVVTKVLESNVLGQYPMAQALFQGLGLAWKDPATNAWRMPSLLGLLQNPQGWLLSPAVLGDASGLLSLASLQKVLARIPAAEAASLGIGIKPYAGTNGSGLTGIEVYGFPYGFGAVLSTDGAKVADFILQTANLSVAGGHGAIESLQGGISLGANFQPGVLGELRISGDVAGATLFAEAAYDKNFTFTVGQEKTQSTALSLQLVPFVGWGTLIEQAIQAAAATLLDTLVPKLFAALKAQGSAPLTDFVTRLQTAGTDLDAASLVAAITAIPVANLSPETVGDAVLAWLLARFNAANAPQTAAAVVALLNGVLPGTVAVGQGTADSGLVSYQPAAGVPVTLYIGVYTPPGAQAALLGLWAGVQLPSSALLVAEISRTGVGFPVAQLTSGAEPVFQFGVNLFVPVEGGTVGPALQLDYDPAAHRFNGMFDPLFNSAAAAGSQQSPMTGELFPDFFLNSADAVETWLLQVVKNVLPRYVSTIVLNADAVKTWLQAPLIGAVNDSPTAALLLEGGQLIQNTGTANAPLYILTPFDTLLALTPEAFLGGLLAALMQKEIQVLSWGTAVAKTLGGLWIGPAPGTTDTLGVRVAAPGLVLPEIPNLTIQLGDADDSWIASASSSGANTSYEPGLSFYVPNGNTGGDYRPDFTSPLLRLVNAGIDLTGTAGKPLVDLARFQLGGVSPRVLLSLAFTKGSPAVSFGAGFTLDNLALSLAPNQATASGNPVAQNLLGAGSPEGAGSKDNPPANPAFSLQAAYVDKLFVQLLDADGNPATKIWFPVERGFGPLYVNKLGVGWVADHDPQLFDALFDGTVSLADFRVDLIGLSIGIPVNSSITDFSKYQLGLDGFDLTFQGGPVSIAAEFLEDTSGGVTEYSGLASVKTSGFSLMAVGSYAAVPTNPPATSPTATSLFIFGALNAPLGGVPAFFITGVAAGFSYNRGLKLPPITGVQTFPLVEGVVKGSFQSSSSGDAKSALATLSEAVYPEIGQYWLAAGLVFTSFRLIDGFALLFVEFGNHLEFALLGLASMALPKGTAQSDALAYVELALKAVVDPGQGVISLEAQLTPNSFVIESACKLTGGFAFYLWLKDQVQDGNHISAGDFVVTLGGYHPAFNKPAWYPDVPRLGFHWPIELGFGSISVDGGVYFALTPSAIMAGGYLHAAFEAGPIRAWFDAHADFLTGWAPFYYIVDIGIDVGVAFETTIAGVSITLKASLGANLHLEGPPTHGQAEVNWYIISFTIPIGSGSPPATSTLHWPDFSASFLPKPAAPPANTNNPPPPPPAARLETMDLAVEAADPPPPPPQQQTVKLQAAAGLVSTGGSTWILNAQPFMLRMDTAIPINSITVGNPGAPTLAGGQQVGIQPMNKSSIDTPVTLQINDVTGNPVDLSQSALRFDTLADGSPQGTWGSKTFDRSKTPDGASMVIPGTVKSVRVIGDQCVSSSAVGPFAVANLAYTFNQTVFTLPFVSQLPFNSTPVYAPSAPVGGQDQALALLMSSIMDPAVAARRDQVFQTLRGFGLSAPADPDLSVMKSAANLVLQSPPVLAHVGANVAAAINTGQTFDLQLSAAGSTEMAAASVLPPGTAEKLQLCGTLRRYKTGLAQAQGGGQWQTAARTRRRAAANTTAVGATPAASVVYDGTIAHWHGPAKKVTRDGSLPIRLTCFDENDELIADLHDPAETEVTLPDRTRALSVHGLSAVRAEDDAGAAAFAGWHRGDEVLKATARCYLGDGFTLRPQAFVYQQRNRRPLRQGLIDIAELAEGNHVTGDKPGAWETVFAGRMRAAAVRVPHGTAPDQIAVALAFSDNPAAVRDYHRLAPAATLELTDETVYFYELTGEETAAGAHFCVWTKALGATDTILGVSAAARDAGEMKQLWPGPAIAGARPGLRAAAAETVEPAADSRARVSILTSAD